MIAWILAAAIGAGTNVVDANRIWLDAPRARYIPAHLFWDANAQAKLPVVIVSPDIGENCDSYDPLARQWAAAGLMVVVLTHQGSNCNALNNRVYSMKDLSGVDRPAPAIVDSARRALSNDPEVESDRVGDLRFTLPKLSVLDREDADVKGRIDVTSVGIAGHGFGFRSAIDQLEANPPDPALKAVAVISSAPDAEWDVGDRALVSPVPFLFLGTGRAPDRDPFPGLVAPAKFLVIARVSSGFRFLDAGDCGSGTDYALPDWAGDVSITFWKAFLSGDADARARLDRKAAGDCGSDCRVEAADQRDH